MGRLEIINNTIPFHHLPAAFLLLPQYAKQTPVMA